MSAYSTVASTSISRGEPAEPGAQDDRHVGHAREPRANDRRRARSTRSSAMRRVAAVRDRAVERRSALIPSPTRTRLATRRGRPLRRRPRRAAVPARDRRQRRLPPPPRSRRAAARPSRAAARGRLRRARSSPAISSSQAPDLVRGFLPDPAPPRARASRMMSCASRSACSRISPRSCCALTSASLSALSRSRNARSCSWNPLAFGLELLRSAA